MPTRDTNAVESGKELELLVYGKVPYLYKWGSVRPWCKPPKFTILCLRLEVARMFQQTRACGTPVIVRSFLPQQRSVNSSYASHSFSRHVGVVDFLTKRGFIVLIATQRLAKCARLVLTRQSPSLHVAVNVRLTKIDVVMVNTS